MLTIHDSQRGARICCDICDAGIRVSALKGLGSDPCDNPNMPILDY